MSLEKRIKQCAQLSGSFTLRSGATSETYFDKYLFECDPQLLNSICERLATLIPDDTEVLAGLEMGGIPIATVVSQITGLPTAFIRKEPKTYGTRKYAEGAELKGRRLTLIEDVVSSGGAIIDALQKLDADGIHPIGIVCVIDRQSGGTENLRAAGYELRSAFTMQDINSAT